MGSALARVTWEPATLSLCKVPAVSQLFGFCGRKQTKSFNFCVEGSFKSEVFCQALPGVSTMLKPSPEPFAGAVQGAQAYTNLDNVNAF